MELKTHRPVAVFDLDGVIVANPSESHSTTITNTGYWANHWNSPEEAVIQTEVTRIIQALISSGVQVVILTARPEAFRKVTERVLYRAGIFVQPYNINRVTNGNYSNGPLLCMMGGNEVTTGGAAWKQATIKKWQDSGNTILFMMEDYRPNAEAVRALVPVLLYERKKVSQYLNADCLACGSLTECFCADVALARANS